jgi:hypothetical protein
MQYLQKLIVAMKHIMLSVIMTSAMAPHQQQNQWLGNPIKRSADHENATLSITFKSDA